MIERGQHLRFTPEPREPIGIAREGVWQDFQRDLAIQSGVAGAVDLTHSAFAKFGKDLVGSEARQRHTGAGIIGWARIQADPEKRNESRVQGPGPGSVINLRRVLSPPA